MPYIKKSLRPTVIKKGPTNAGELNYLVTIIAIRYVQEGEVSYRKINDAIGALECAKLELYRRLAAPYEDKKIIENGDVY